MFKKGEQLMHEHVLNLKFNSIKECDEWEKEHLYEDGRMKYNGEFILMVNHSSSIGSDEVTLVSVFTV